MDHNAKHLMPQGKVESNAKGKGKQAKGKPETPAPEAKVETPAPVATAEPPATVTAPPAPPATVEPPKPEATAPDPLDKPFILAPGLALALASIPEATRKVTSQVTLPSMVMGKAKTILGKALAPEAIKEAIIEYATVAASVLDIGATDTFLCALEQAIEREHKEGIATAKAKRAQEEATRRAKLRDDLQGKVKGMVLTLSKDLVEMVNLAHKDGLFIVIHGPIDLALPLDKQAQGAGLYVREKGATRASIPHLGSGSKEGGATGDSNRRSFTYYDDSKGGIEIQGSLMKYMQDTYPASFAVKVETDLAARRERGETKSRISAWDAYLKGKDQGDTFILRQVESK